jgi:hypothetical protein
LTQLLQIHLATELEAAGDGSVTAAFGYNRAFRGSTLKSSFNTNGEVAVALDKEIFGSFKLNMVGVMDHWNQKYKFGLGLTMSM